MYLDETILQSTTTLTLVKFIDELWECIEEDSNPWHHNKEYDKLEKKYNIIKDRATKASKKRSFK